MAFEIIKLTYLLTYLDLYLTANSVIHRPIRHFSHLQLQEMDKGVNCAIVELLRVVAHTLRVANQFNTCCCSYEEQRLWA